MKKILSILALLTQIITARAATYTYTPNSSALNDLSHDFAFTWGITLDGALSGQKILSAKLVITDIWDASVEDNSIFVHLLNNPLKGVNVVSDRAAGNADFFAGQGFFLKEWKDPVGGVNDGFDLVMNFSAAQMAELTNYINDPRSVYSDFGFGFDPDCHYYTGGVTFVITTNGSIAGSAPVRVAEGGATLLFLAMGLATLRGFKRLVRS